MSGMNMNEIFEGIRKEEREAAGESLTIALAALRDVSKELADANDAIQRVRELHWEFRDPEIETQPWCDSCGLNYPCPTIKALDGSHE